MDPNDAGLPPLLYKYCNERGIDILDNLRLKITRPVEFNDPFEFSPVVEKTLSLNAALGKAQNPATIRATYEDLLLSRRINVPYEEFEEFAYRHRFTTARKFIADHPHTALEFQRYHQEMISEQSGVLCLSETYEEFLMWGHYSDGHRGIVIGIATDEDGLSAYGSPLLKVEYEQERARVRMEIPANHPEMRQQVIATTRRKSDHWYYEKEWRQLHTLRECKPEEFKNARTGATNVIHFLPIQAFWVKVVIFGCRCDPLLEKKVREVLDQPEFTHVRQLRAVVDDDEFKFVFLKVT